MKPSVRLAIHPTPPGQNLARFPSIVVPMHQTPSSAHKRTPLTDALELIAWEADRVTRESDWLQSRLASRALQSADPSLAQDLAVIDGMAQKLMVLSQVLAELRHKVPPEVTVDLAAGLAKLAAA